MNFNNMCNAQRVITAESRSIERLRKSIKGTDIDLRTTTERFDTFDATASSGDPKTILLIEIKERNHDLGTYDSTIIEEDKVNRILSYRDSFKRLYEEYDFIPVLITLFNNNVHTLHRMDREPYSRMERTNDHYTLSDQSNKIIKRYNEYKITEPTKILIE